MARERAFVVPSSDGNIKTRLRFKRSRPWVHLPGRLGDDGARSLAVMLRRCARDGYAVTWSARAWKPLVEIATGEVLEIDLAIEDVDQALARAAELARRERETGRAASEASRAASDAGETVAAYAKRWTADRKAREISSSADSFRRLELHAFPVVDAGGVRFGDRAMRSVTRDHVEAVVEQLDAKVRAGGYLDAEGHHESFGARMALHVWGDVTSLFADATDAKAKILRVLEADPCERVHGPDRGVDKAKVYLWPGEFLSFVKCDDVPLRWRRVVTIATYLYARPGELAALEWSDVDLARRVVHFHRAIDRVRDADKVKSTKTKVARRIPIEPELMPLLRAMHRESGGAGRVLTWLPSTGSASAAFRKYLARAAVKRADLHHGDATRKAITFYDLRATGITWHAARGDDPLRIQQRAGHESFTTTAGYIREAENLGHAFGDVFPALPRAELAIAAGDVVGPDRGPARRADRGKPENQAGSGWALQDLNL